MREFIRPAPSGVSIAGLAISIAAISGSGALAQAKNQMAPAQAAPSPQQPPQIKQIVLTDKQVEGVLAAAKEMDPITEKIAPHAKPDPKITAQLEGNANKN